MCSYTFRPRKKPLVGNLTVPGDKSISHRAVMLGALATGKTTIENFLDGEDCLRTIDIFRKFGVAIEQNGTNVVIESGGVSQFAEPKVPLYFGNSGTTARLMLGILAGIPYFSVVYGDPFLTERPMGRVTIPLKKMGAIIDGRSGGERLPIAIRGTTLKSIEYELPVKSAQVKSAVLLASLFAKGTTVVREKGITRDHTENMLQAFGIELSKHGSDISLNGGQTLFPAHITVPGDISSAAFWMVAAAIVPDSSLTLTNVGINKTRAGIIEVLQKMNANVMISNERESGNEKIADITITYGNLTSTTIEGEIIPALIDEIPIIALLASQAEGTTIIKDAQELRVKETDRIQAVVDVLNTLGASIEEREDGMVIHGKTPLHGGKVKSYSDHRIAMMAAIASFITRNEVIIDDVSVIDISYPTFLEHFEQLQS